MLCHLRDQKFLRAKFGSILRTFLASSRIWLFVFDTQEALHMVCRINLKSTDDIYIILFSTVLKLMMREVYFSNS